jgi:hypothetical protein
MRFYGYAATGEEVKSQKPMRIEQFPASRLPYCVGLLQSVTISLYASQ